MSDAPAADVLKYPAKEGKNNKSRVSDTRCTADVAIMNVIADKPSCSAFTEETCVNDHNSNTLCHADLLEVVESRDAHVITPGGALKAEADVSECHRKARLSSKG